MKNIESRLNEVLEYLKSNAKLENALRAAHEGNSATEQELRIASEALRDDSSENRWVLLSTLDNGNVEEWVRDGFKLVIKFAEGSVELSVFKPYGMSESDRIRYFNETYMREFGRGKTIDDLSQVSWCGIAYNVDNVMDKGTSVDFHFIFVDYMKYML